jgi:hypothetical protein
MTQQEDIKRRLKIMENIDNDKLQYLVKSLRKIEGFEFDMDDEDQSIALLNDKSEIKNYITPTIMSDTEGIISKYIQKHQKLF